MDTFSKEAMNTEMEIRICGADFNYARSAAEDCFSEVFMLEDLLSMYRLGSDVSMVNTCPKGEVCKLTDSATECLMAAFAASEMSMGAVDVCMGEFFLDAKKDAIINRPKIPRRGKFALDPENYLIQKIEDGMIDLGAIGKGYAVDRCVKKLMEVWDIENAFISFGASSIYAYGKPDNAQEWSVSLDEAGKTRIPLRNAAVGDSGTAVQGAHIIDARTGKVPDFLPYRTWAFGASAAIADAMSTAFMLLEEPQIRQICDEYNLSAAIQKTEDSEIIIIE